MVQSTQSENAIKVRSTHKHWSVVWPFTWAFQIWNASFSCQSNNDSIFIMLVQFHSLQIRGSDVQFQRIMIFGYFMLTLFLIPTGIQHLPLSVCLCVYVFVCTWWIFEEIKMGSPNLYLGKSIVCLFEFWPGSPVPQSIVHVVVSKAASNSVMWWLDWHL